MRFAAASRSALVLVAISLFSGSSRASELTIESLLARFQKVPGLEAKYREEQHLSLLAAPLVSTGTIHFAPPDRLARHTLTPQKSSVLVDGHSVAFGTAAKNEAVDLDGNPVAKLFVETFLRILAGDRAWLEANYTIQLKSSGSESWELSLAPKNAPMTGILKSLELSGRGLVFERMKLTESSGDDTVTTFSDVNLDKHYSPDERARVFSLPGKAK